MDVAACQLSRRTKAAILRVVIEACIAIVWAYLSLALYFKTLQRCVMPAPISIDEAPARIAEIVIESADDAAVGAAAARALVARARGGRGRGRGAAGR